MVLSSMPVSILDNLLGIVAQVHDQMETGMEDDTIQWGKRLIIQDLSEDDALTHFHFQKVHLQEVADKLWPRLQCFLIGHRGSFKAYKVQGEEVSHKEESKCHYSP